MVLLLRAVPAGRGSCCRRSSSIAPSTTCCRSPSRCSSWSPTKLRQRRVAGRARVGAAFGWLAEQLTPRVLAVFTFLAGVVLLFSGATPAAAGRLALLDRVLPLGVIEASHFLGSVVGAGAAAAVAGAGAAARCRVLPDRRSRSWSASRASLLKGVRLRRSRAAPRLILLVVCAARGRPSIGAPRSSRRGSRPAWIAAVAGALGASIWLGLFAFKHVEYSRRAVVAVRAARRSVALPARLGRRRDRGAARRRLPG